MLMHSAYQSYTQSESEIEQIQVSQWIIISKHCEI